MTSFKCPGFYSFLQPKPESIRCPFCGEEVEIWTDEIKTLCPKCKNVVTRDILPQCIEWCSLAKECVGEKLYEKYIQNRKITLKEKLLEKIEEFFGKDRKRIEHAKNVMRFAQKLLEKEKGDWHIVIPASILHDVGIKVTEERYHLQDAFYQEKEGPPIARKILLELGFKKEDIEKICEIIAFHHSPGKINSQNFKIVYDADMLENLQEKIRGKDKKEVEKIINQV
ncbi:HD domain-containing protein, partial [Candidatus Aerophobetes bacterium]|nr:HD domain-containing protein [Candidatus Aerophobetes bacterium]